MNWRDLLPLAARLAAGPAEGEWRSAAGRGYYAAFHIARSLLSDLGFTVPRADRAHQYLAFRLSNSGASAVSQAGRDLETLRRLRNRADYDASPAFTQAEAAASVRLAEHIIQVLDSARQEPTRSQITDAMKIYERDVLKDVTWKP
jgi:uncharacterized protein (UPF0332 family)